MSEPLIIIGQIIHFTAPGNLQVLSDGFIIVNSGKITAIGPKAQLNSTDTNLAKVVELTKTQLLIPGLIDTHIHAPQYPNVGLGYDKPLLEWLDSYTYKLEKQYKDPNLSQKVYNAVVRKTLDHGTTTACYFGSLFYDSSVILADAVKTHGQRALVGKINMINLAPDDYIETREESIRLTKKFVETIKSFNSPLIQPVITPRFAPSVDAELMSELGRIAADGNLHIQTHISENRAEVQLVRDTFGGESYAKVYDNAGLLTNKTILAHGIYLTDEEIALLRQRGTAISHCPESNTNLKSGLCDVRKLQKAGLNIGLGTDVAGGASPSIIGAMRAAIGVSTHISFNQPDYKPLDFADVFYLATLGGARALALDHEIGNFQVGKSFDALIVDVNVPNSSVDYLDNAETPLEILQKFVFLADDRNVRQVFVQGKKVK